ncbi:MULTISPECIES: helix-turn-helix domain-containing protein [unclassified Novosphingobium]|uniref:helix-turn-helix domain-containing protein n=1 Tax=unclassified Novosphingobium TaxID=2644732 RepID=UPI000D30436B|nr:MULTISPECIES: helix-turn-helix domain-containing protein [unclassified Novosphingobium]PTR12594.1 hypothetical protein C8K11_10247 [Novosphingobium sp. GV055]PUB06378.1 hypothetical protein C8K12_10247 [Novosphingobium sp. GV061]PUB22429.1 hypothetical protein C8K14_10247 [Novosphingobium sp. GV079]PUB44454.1 hypothetical protein C8K10_10247 [Novosphingobium sp. GV027]
MSSQSQYPVDRAAIMAELKKIIGRRIEDQRLLQRMTQARLAAKVGIGIRWLREIEMGGPRARLDDYLRCAHGVGLSSAQILIPMLFLEHQKPVPPAMYYENIYDIEEQWIERLRS